MERKIDRRVARTKKILIDTFLQLVKEKGYSQVTVKDIVDCANYNRATFYVHFESKELLAKELLNEKIRQFSIEFRRPLEHINILNLEKLSPDSVTVFDYVKTNHDFFDLLKVENTIPSFRSSILTEICRLFEENIIFQGKQDFDSNNQYFVYYRAYGVFGIFLEWIKDDYSIPTKEISKKLLNALSAYSPIVIKHDQ